MFVLIGVFFYSMPVAVYIDEGRKGYDPRWDVCEQAVERRHSGGVVEGAMCGRWWEEGHWEGRQDGMMAG